MGPLVVVISPLAAGFASGFLVETVPEPLELARLGHCRVMWAELLPQRPAIETAQALEHAMSYSRARPYAIWSDNGGEFKGDFQRLLDLLGIEHAWTEAYTPQQNGKIERWWPTLERRPPGVPLMEWVERYNKIEHLSLPRNPKVTDAVVNYTPNEAYSKLEQWSPGVQGTWQVDGEVLPFKVGVRAKKKRSERAKAGHQKRKPRTIGEIRKSWGLED
jgi:hypothetical protein